MLEVRLRQAKLQLVVTKIRLDAGQPLVREVVRVDRMLEVRVERLDLAEHRLGLCLLPGNRPRGGKRRRGDCKSHHESEQQQPRLSFEEAGQWAIPTTTGAPERGRYVTWGAP